jgi:hypothetical protein
MLEYDKHRSKSKSKFFNYVSMFIMRILLEFLHTSMQYFHHQMEDYHIRVHIKVHQDSIHPPKLRNIMNEISLMMFCGLIRIFKQKL